MPGRGLEPLRISPPDPKSGASANFATLAEIPATVLNPSTIACFAIALPSKLTSDAPDLYSAEQDRSIEIEQLSRVDGINPVALAKIDHIIKSPPLMSKDAPVM